MSGEMEGFQTTRSGSAQETNIQDEESCQGVESRYECPICMSWLVEPVLTSCGHRFCNKCITSWLQKPESRCPIDNKPLLAKDIFPDNFTRREIHQIRKPCINAKMGCPAKMSPIDMDNHLIECEFRNQNKLISCPFSDVGCSFQNESQVTVNEHAQNELASHLQLLMKSFTLQKSTNGTLKGLEASALWEPTKQPMENSLDIKVYSHDNSIKALYERIVVLEQRNLEQTSRIAQLSDRLERVMRLQNSDVPPRQSGGVLLWHITQFNSKVDAMRTDPNIMFYSNEAYTSPYGYKFCARLNIPPKRKDYLGLHIHLMQSENDFHLDWPFQGRIKIIMIHTDMKCAQQDTIMSKPEILAFHRPLKEISLRGFGFMEYANIFDIKQRGFVKDDTLIIKIQINIV